MCVCVCVCVRVFRCVSVEMEERRDYSSWRVAEDGERNYKRNSRGLSKGEESLGGIQRSRNRDAQWRPLSSGLQGPPRQNLLHTLPEGNY